MRVVDSGRKARPKRSSSFSFCQIARINAMRTDGGQRASPGQTAFRAKLDDRRSTFDRLAPIQTVSMVPLNLAALIYI
jgi:hypothetical protein